MDRTTTRDNPNRKRSRSPYRKDDGRRKRPRSSTHKQNISSHTSNVVQRLPFQREPLDKRHLEQFKPLFAEYLDVQKHLDIDDLSSEEVKGRWKSFFGKWNRGELAEGWYDLDMQRRVEERYDARPKPTPRHDTLPRTSLRDLPEDLDSDGEGDGDRDDGYGPALPSSTHRAGPAIPKRDDLQHRRELANEDHAAQAADRRWERKQERKAQTERLDELAPRADPSSRERQLEKKRETTAVNRAFREANEPGAEDVGDGDLMGDDGGVGAYKKELKAREKTKSEREIRKEEVLRARAAEREEKLTAHRMKEEKTMDMLRGLARQRFG